MLCDWPHSCRWSILVQGIRCHYGASARASPPIQSGVYPATVLAQSYCTVPVGTVIQFVRGLRLRYCTD